MDSTAVKEQGPTLSRLGFGTSGLMGRLGRPQSRRLLDAAFDCGITHFDTARLYGFGEAEGVVGEFIADKRSCVTVTTKAGILPPRRSGALSVARAAVRSAARAFPLVGRLARGVGEAMSKAGCFEVPSLESSLESSLREMRTDYVDIFLLHDCQPEDLRDDVLQFLERVRSEGKILEFGVAGSAEVATAALAAAFGRVVQLPNSLWDPAINRMRQPGGSAVITHSSLSGGFAALRDRLLREPSLAEIWSAHFQMDCTNPAVVGALLLKHSTLMNAKGCVLFSSSDAGRIRTNVSVLEERSIDVAELPRLVQERLPAATQAGSVLPI